MDFEFFKLANVDENSVVTEDTYSLVVNGNDVQKTKNSLIKSKFYKDFTDEYEEWASQQQATQGKDIETFVKTLITTDGVPYKGYIESTVGGTALFEVAGDNTNSRQHLEVFYESGEVVKNLKVCDFYNSTTISSNIYSIINGQIRHSDESNLLSVNSIANRGDLENTGNMHVGGKSVLNDVRASSVHVGTSAAPYININSTTIDFIGQNSGVKIKHDGNGNIVVSEGNLNTKITGLSSPTDLNDAANKQYVDSLAETISLPSNKIINLNTYQRKRVTISGQINELSFINLSGNGPEECWVIFKTSSTAYSSSKNFNMHTTSGIVYPSNIDLGARECFALGKTYMIHFVKAKDTTDAWKTFATITEYNI